MIALTHPMFEELWFGAGEPVLIYFTAPWCGPCRRLDKEAIEAVAAECGLQTYICDLTVNDYTAGFCGIRSIPTFMIQEPGKVIGKLTNSDTDTVCKWILSLKSD